MTDEEHTRAHELLRDSFDSISDKYVARRRRGLNAKNRQDSEMQAMFGRIGGLTKSEIRGEMYQERQSKQIKAALEKGTFWYHQPTDTYITVKGKEKSLIRELQSKLLEAVPKFTGLDDSQKLKGFRDSLAFILNATGRYRFHTHGFFLLGILLSPDLYQENFSLKTYYLSKIGIFKPTAEKPLFVAESRAFKAAQLKNNLKKRSHWAHVDLKDLVVMEPISLKAIDLISALGKKVKKRYSTSQVSLFTPIIRDERTDIVTLGWRLIKQEETNS